MSKIKFIPMAAAVATLGTALATAVNVAAYGPVDRPTYTLEDINKAASENPDKTTAAYKTFIEQKKVVLNSITNDGVIGDERNFVAAYEEGKNWNYDEITVEEGKTYNVTMYIHNNSPLKTQAVANDVNAVISMPLDYGKELKVSGFINAANATPSQYWDSVVFKSANGQNFYLDYVEGSATETYNKVDANGNIIEKGLVKSISDKVITKSGVSLGDMPGCFEYSKYVTIKVKPVFTDANFTVEKVVRKNGDKNWVESVDAKVGDKIDYRIHYKIGRAHV